MQTVAARNGITEATNSLDYWQPSFAIETGGYEALSHHEALYMATVGGAKGGLVTPKFPYHMIADAIDCVNEDCSEKK